MLVGAAEEFSREVQAELGSQEEDAIHSREVAIGEKELLVKEEAEEPDHTPRSFAKFATMQGAQKLSISHTQSLCAPS